jgi:ABC-type uncharacterized transport system substrate-binding protein
MEFNIKHIGVIDSKPAKYIELTIKGWNNIILEDITTLYGSVDINLIAQLKEIVNELENHNIKLSEMTKKNEK